MKKLAQQIKSGLNKKKSSSPIFISALIGMGVNFKLQNKSQR
jgi:hypothetical protein